MTLYSPLDDADVRSSADKEFMSKSGRATGIGALLLAIGASACSPGVPEKTEAAPTTRTAYIEVKGMIQQLGIT